MSTESGQSRKGELNDIDSIAQSTNPLAVGSRCPFVQTNVGAVGTQANTNPGLSPLAFALLSASIVTGNQGKSYSDAVNGPNFVVMVNMLKPPPPWTRSESC